MSSIMFSVIAAAEPGRSCNRSSRFRAVTTTSSRPADESAAKAGIATPDVPAIASANAALAAVFNDSCAFTNRSPYMITDVFHKRSAVNLAQGFTFRQLIFWPTLELSYFLDYSSSSGPDPLNISCSRILVKHRNDGTRRHTRPCGQRQPSGLQQLAASNYHVGIMRRHA